MYKFLFLIPLYNDWRSLDLLLKKINLELKKKRRYSEIFIVNDASTIKKVLNTKNLPYIKKIFIINLKKNIGSQKCIYVGLKYISYLKKKYIVTILDSDGEDNPKEINKMIDLSLIKENYIITSNRLSRKEILIIRFLYRIHLVVTFIVTGKWISFGNYTSLNIKNVQKITRNKDICYAYSAAVIKHAKIIRTFANREKRFFDKSKVNSLGLIFHSLRIISVFQKIIFARSIIAILALIILKYLLLLNKNFLIILVILIILLNIIIIVNKIFFKVNKTSRIKSLIKDVSVI